MIRCIAFVLGLIFISLPAHAGVGVPDAVTRQQDVYMKCVSHHFFGKLPASGITVAGQVDRAIAACEHELAKLRVALTSDARTEDGAVRITTQLKVTLRERIYERFLGAMEHAERNASR
jgi:hypothetical protein